MYFIYLRISVSKINWDTTYSKFLDDGSFNGNEWLTIFNSLPDFPIGGWPSLLNHLRNLLAVVAAGGLHPSSMTTPLLLLLLLLLEVGRSDGDALLYGDIQDVVVLWIVAPLTVVIELVILAGCGTQSSEATGICLVLSSDESKMKPQNGKVIQSFTPFCE